MTAIVIPFPRLACHECGWQAPEVRVRAFVPAVVADMLDTLEGAVEVETIVSCPCGALVVNPGRHSFDCLDIEIEPTQPPPSEPTRDGPRARHLRRI